jgi:hypothetical protein
MGFKRLLFAGDAGVIDKDIDAAEAADRLVDKRSGGAGVVREIGEHHFRAAAHRTTRSGDGDGLLTRTEMMESDIGARIRQVLRGTRAETRTGTGDARNAREPGATCHFFSQVWWKWRC